MATLRAYLVDDEILALRRLDRLLAETGRVQIAGSSTSPLAAVDFLTREVVDVLFLDIQMPGLNGFELLARLPVQPAVIFTTAFDRYALQAFEVNSFDYLLKPVGTQQLDRALRKVEALGGAGRIVELQAQLQGALQKLIGQFSTRPRTPPDRITSRVGDRIVLLDLGRITHFIAKDKLTHASVDGKEYVVDYTISDLEEKLTASGFARIHRSTLINLSLVDELRRWFRGRMVVRMRDRSRTELYVSRDQVRSLRERLDLSSGLARLP
jgi:two-component system, LytTR family, response regulator